MRILLIEDNHRLSQSLCRSLVDEGYAVDLAYDGEEGEMLADVTPYDAIIMDVMLPKKDGLEILAEQTPPAHTPVRQDVNLGAAPEQPSTHDVVAVFADMRGLARASERLAPEVLREA